MYLGNFGKGADEFSPFLLFEVVETVHCRIAGTGYSALAVRVYPDMRRQLLDVPLPKQEVYSVLSMCVPGHVQTAPCCTPP